MRILLGLTGSIATRLASKLLTNLHIDGHSMEVVATESATPFLKDQNIFYFRDYNEDYTYQHHKEVLHINLTREMDAFIIAPCTANTLAKIANGLSDNLLTNCVRAWDFSKPFIIAPAMNTQMWNHPLTPKHLAEIQSWSDKVKIIPPQSKELFCGEVGNGAVANISDILAVLKN
jgi:phosphopantothenoylcysteine synthetase/decarboxylase